MKARPPPGPANTMSRGSSPTSSVRTTLGGSDATSTTLTLSERRFTTQTSPGERTATATGSKPTGTAARCVRPVAPTSKISRRLSGVLTAHSRLPSAERASGRTWPLSNVTNDELAAAAGEARTRASSRGSAPTKRADTGTSFLVEAGRPSMVVPARPPRSTERGASGAGGRLNGRVERTRSAGQNAPREPSAGGCFQQALQVALVQLVSPGTELAGDVRVPVGREHRLDLRPAHRHDGCRHALAAAAATETNRTLREKGQVVADQGLQHV